jgi:hypothetical protein
MTLSTNLPTSRAPAPQASGLNHASVLALDLGTVTGFALRAADSAIVSGTVSFRPSRYDGGGIRYLRFRAWLESIAEDTGSIGAVHYEEVRRHLSTDAAHVHGVCSQRSLPGASSDRSPIRPSLSAPSSGSSPAAATPTRLPSSQQSARAATARRTTMKPTPSPSCCGRWRPVEACDEVGPAGL